MRRVTTAVVLALCLYACGSTAPPADQVELVTISPRGEIGCWLIPTYGELVADPEFGVAFKHGLPAVWPIGYTARRVGTEVEVLDSYGKVVARTGIGLQQIWWGGGTTNGPGSGYICQANRAEEHLQPDNASAPKRSGKPRVG